MWHRLNIGPVSQTRAQHRPNVSIDVWCFLGKCKWEQADKKHSVLVSKWPEWDSGVFPRSATFLLWAPSRRIVVGLTKVHFLSGLTILFWTSFKLTMYKFWNSVWEDSGSALIHVCWYLTPDNYIKWRDHNWSTSYQQYYPHKTARHKEGPEIYISFNTWRGPRFTTFGSGWAVTHQRSKYWLNVFLQRLLNWCQILAFWNIDITSQKNEPSMFFVITCTKHVHI